MISKVGIDYATQEVVAEYKFDMGFHRNVARHLAGRNAAFNEMQILGTIPAALYKDWEDKGITQSPAKLDKAMKDAGILDEGSGKRIWTMPR